MGFISRFDLNRICRDFNTPVFIETGTWKGDGVQAALAAPFTSLISIEIVPAIALEAKQRFASETRVRILEGKSTDVLSRELPDIGSNCLFWLDAHFPGAEEGLESYDAGEDEDIRLPLEKELGIICSCRNGFRDVLVIDDLRVYEDGPYGNGNAPADTLPRNARDLDFVNRLFGESHFIARSFLDEGYLLLFPRPEYERFRRDEQDIYLA